MSRECSDLKTMLFRKLITDRSAVPYKYSEVFHAKAPFGVSPLYNVDHAVELVCDLKLCHRPPNQLFPAELAAARQYVDTLFLPGKTRSHWSPYGGSSLVCARARYECTCGGQRYSFKSHSRSF